MNLKLYKLLNLTALFLANGIAQAAINLDINPIAQSGNSVDIGIVISGLDSGAAPSLSTYDLDLNFDPSQLSFASADFGNQLDLFNSGSNLTTAEITSPGVLNLFELSFDSPADLNILQADSFTLATLTFNIVNAGTSQLEIFINALGDADGNPLANVALTSASITTVPLPPAFFMMAPVLAGLAYKGKNRKIVL
ncbi:MAG: hypothetical protein HOP23_03010 [Methylococcaceae bacterium]|nr:hypothetical protein [Methylococcaceae bacterium]